MKRIFSLFFLFTFFNATDILAQTENETDKSEQSISQAGDKDDKVKRKTVEKSSGNNVYSQETTQPASPYANNDVGGFTVRKFKESKTKKKLRRGESRTRMSVPDPKGKPLKHKKKRKSIFSKR